MRGLDTRVLLAQARIMAFVDRMKAKEMFLDVKYRAQTQGVIDSCLGIDRAPAMFAGEEARLLRWWREGYRIACQCVKLDVCELCDVDGYPCPIHNPPFFMDEL